MRKVLKWIGIVLGGLVGLIVLALVALYVTAEVRLNRTYTVQPEAVTIPTDPAAIQRGRQWAAVHCTICHGENLAGTLFFDDPSLGRIHTPNLTSGQGGVGGTLSDADFVRAIRHGVRRDGKPLFAMSSSAFYYLSDADLGAIIAYAKSVPPVDNPSAGYTLTPLAKILLAAGAFGDEILSAEVIDHTGPRPPAPEPGVTVAYGEYLVNIGDCRTCHGPQLSGGQSPDPAAPPAPNLTPGGELGGWSEGDFITAMRTGVTPTGRQLSEFMPWEYVGRMTDDELKALWLYLQSLPAQETTQ